MHTCFALGRTPTRIHQQSLSNNQDYNKARDGRMEKDGSENEDKEEDDNQRAKNVGVGDEKQRGLPDPEASKTSLTLLCSCSCSLLLLHFCSLLLHFTSAITHFLCRSLHNSSLDKISQHHCHFHLLQINSPRPSNLNPTTTNNCPFLTKIACLGCFCCGQVPGERLKRKLGKNNSKVHQMELTALNLFSPKANSAACLALLARTNIDGPGGLLELAMGFKGPN